MRSITRTALAGALAGALLLAGCGDDSDSDAAEETTTTEAAAAIEITDAWARQSPMGTTAGAVYMNITAAEDDALVSASVPGDVAGTVEVHETVMAEEGMEGESMEGESTETTMAEGGMDETTDTTMAEGGMDETTETTMGEGDMGEGDMGDDMGTMTMQEVESIELPAGETVELKPGGFHIMLLDLVEPLEVGDEIEVTLTFESGATQTVVAEVREA
jgi:copper(I)-binding protein